MPFRLMCLLFRNDLTVTDNLPLCSLPTHTHTHTPQESEFQETASDRTDDREAVDGRLSGMEKTGGSSSVFFFTCPMERFEKV